MPRAAMEGPSPAAARWPRETALFRLTRVSVFWLLRAVFRFRVNGLQNVPAGPAVIVANHPSAVDPLFICAAVPERLLFVAAEEFLVMRGFVGWAMRAYGCIPVRRGGIDMSAIKESLRALADGRKVALFPEGSIGAEPRPPQRGAALITARAGVPIVPAAIRGTGSVFPLGARFPRPGRVSLRFGPTIPAPGPDTEAAEIAVSSAMAWVHSA
ncbi:MAG: lysophospholipid acyltransferase family protein [Armatimonadota bacterium]